MKKRFLTMVLAGIMALSLTSVCVQADDAAWPDKNVTFYVPASAGGGTDVSARAIASAISETTGSSVIVSDLTSGNGTVAYETVRNSSPDGTELLYYHQNFFLNYYNGIYDQAPLEEFTPISVAAFLVEQVIVVKADSEYETLDDLVNAAKEGTIKAGVQNGGFDDLIIKLLSADAGVDFKLVEAGSETDRITAVLGNNIDVAVVSANLAAQYEENGDMKVLATSAEERDENYPDYPTCKELGYENTVFNAAFMVFGPKDMDPALVEALNKEIAATGDSQYFTDYLETSGSTLAMYDVKETNAFVEQVDESIKTALGK